MSQIQIEEKISRVISSFFEQIEGLPREDGIVIAARVCYVLKEGLADCDPKGLELFEKTQLDCEAITAERKAQEKKS